MVTSFQQLVNEVQSGVKHTIAVAAAQDADVLEALQKAAKENLATVILLGDQQQIEKIAKSQKINVTQHEILHCQDEEEAVRTAVQIIRQGKAEILMKGICSTAILMKAVLDKETGLRESGLLSHLAVFEIASYPKLIFMSDAALNIAPTLAEKISITQNAIAAAHRLGLQKPKVALLAAVEKINPEKMSATVDAALIAKMGERGQIKGAIIDGPLALDNAFSAKSCAVKGIVSEVGGDADIAIVPDIEAGNIFYKLMSYLAGAKTAGVILGAKVPIVLTSRADSEETKFLSIATAARIS
ncbi:MAG: phosphate butyryltransferase [Calditrichia bacterium]